MKPGTRSLARFAEAQAAERLKTLAANLRKAGKHPGHSGPIHDLRVSIRRFTQALRVFKDLWDHRQYRKMRRRLRKLMGLCAAVRNCDISIEVLEAAGVPVAGALKTYLWKRRSRAGSGLSEELEHWNSQAHARQWSGWLSAHTAKRQGIQARARLILGPLERKFLEAGSRAAQPDTSPDELHELRLVGKALRYSLEIFGSLAGPGWDQQTERIREVQDLLGAINDCVTTGGLVTKWRHEIALKHLLDQRLETFRRRWRELYNSKKRRRPD